MSEHCVRDAIYFDDDDGSLVGLVASADHEAIRRVRDYDNVTVGPGERVHADDGEERTDSGFFRSVAAESREEYVSVARRREGS